MNNYTQVMPNQAQAAVGSRYPIDQLIHPFLNIVPSNPPYVIAFNLHKGLTPYIPLLCGLLASQIQNRANENGLRRYLFNHTASNNFANAQFAEMAELAAKLSVYSVTNTNDPNSSWEDHIGQAVNDAILYAIAICYRNDSGLQALVNLTPNEVNDIQQLLNSFNNLQEHFNRMFPQSQGQDSMYPVQANQPVMMMPNQGMQPGMQPGMMYQQPQQSMVQLPNGQVVTQQQAMQMQQQQGMMMPNQGMQPGMMYQQPQQSMVQLPNGQVVTQQQFAMMQQQNAMQMQTMQQPQNYHPMNTGLMNQGNPMSQQPQNNNEAFYGRRYVSPKAQTVSMAPAQQPVQQQQGSLYQDRSQGSQALYENRTAQVQPINHEQIHEHYRNQPVQAVQPTRTYQPTEIQGRRVEAPPIQARAEQVGGSMQPAINPEDFIVAVPNPMPQGWWVTEDSLWLLRPVDDNDPSVKWKPTIEQPYRPFHRVWDQNLYYKIDRVTGRPWYVIIPKTKEEIVDYQKHNPNFDPTVIARIDRAVSEGPKQLIVTKVQVSRDPSLSDSEPDLGETSDEKEILSVPAFAHLVEDEAEQVKVSDSEESAHVIHKNKLVTIAQKTSALPDVYTTVHQVITGILSGSDKKATRFIRACGASTTMFQLDQLIESHMKDAEKDAAKNPGLLALIKDVDRRFAQAYQSRIVHGLGIEGVTVKSLIGVVEPIEKAIRANYGDDFVEFLNKDIRSFLNKVLFAIDSGLREGVIQNAIADNEGEEYEISEVNDFVNELVTYIGHNLTITSINAGSDQMGLSQTTGGKTIAVVDSEDSQLRRIVESVLASDIEHAISEHWILTADGSKFLIHKGLLGDAFYLLEKRI